jgi:hypothetical protein|tara:strand:+ start:3116 stop:3598 length:483 start_codon:yes stop_codon:yes gene_type:complete
MEEYLMATQKQYVNILGTFLVITALLLVSFAKVADTEENYFREVEKNTNIKGFEWAQRPIVIFANSDKDPNFISQMEFLSQDIKALKERDIVVLVDTNPSVPSALRKKLRPHGFAFILIGKDGQVKLRKPSPWNIREIARVIDKMPIRQQEITRKRQEKK